MPVSHGDHQLVSTQRYQSGPPVGRLQEDDEDSIAVTKEEEIVVKKRREEKTTKQTETRVQRQVLLEDGRIVEDSGPTITNNTTQDTKLEENEHTERTTRGSEPPAEGWVALPGSVIIRDKTEKKTNIHDEKEERLDTEETRHLKNFTNDDIVRAIRDNTDLRTAVIKRRGSSSNALNTIDEIDRALIPNVNRRILHQSKKHKRIIDEEDIKEHSEERDGRVVTETTKNEHHEEVDTEEVPDGSGGSQSSVHEVTKETTNNYNNRKNDEQIDYVAVPKGGVVGCRLRAGPAQFLTDQKANTEITDDGHWESLSDRIRRTRQIQERPKGPMNSVQREATPERKDALTQKPLDLDEEEETRKIETSKWLESHFGSESSHGSHEHLDRVDTQSPGISVTMRSKRKEKSEEGIKNTPPHIPPPPPIPKENQKIVSKIYASPSVSPKKEEEVAAKTVPWKIGDRIQVLPVGPENKFFAREAFRTEATPRKNKAPHKPPGINIIPPTPSTLQPSTPTGGVSVKRSQSFNVMPRSYNSPWRKEEPQAKSPPPVPTKTLRSKNSFRFDSKPVEKYQSMTHLRDRFSPERQVKPISRDKFSPEREVKPVDKFPSAQQLSQSNTAMERSKTENDLYATPIRAERNKVTRVESNPPATENKISGSAESTPSQSRVRRISPDFEYQQIYKSPTMRDIKPKYAYTDPDTAKPTPEPPLTPSRRSPPARRTRSGQDSLPPLIPSGPQPPRPAPPRIVAKVTPLPETTIRQIYIEEPAQPIRPVRRKQKQKTDSGTQTNYETQTLDRKRPSKSYYLGQIGNFTNEKKEKQEGGIINNGMNNDGFNNNGRNNAGINKIGVKNDGMKDSGMNYNGSSKNYDSLPSAVAQRRIEEYNNKVNESNDNDYVSRSQTLPRSPKKSFVVLENSKERNTPSEKKTEEVKPVTAPPRVMRSLSFQQKETPRVRPFSRFDPNKNSFNSSDNEPLKSPGIISSISKSQVDISKVESPLERRLENTALYTLPRKRVEPKRIENRDSVNYLTEKRVGVNGAKPDATKVTSKSTVNLTKPESPSPLQRESSFARRFPFNPEDVSTVRFSPNSQENKSQETPRPPFRREKTTDELPLSPGVRQKKQFFEQPIKNESSTLPRVIGGKVKPAHPVTRRESLSPTSPTDEKRKKYLQSLLKNAPELYMTLHGDETDSQVKSVYQPGTRKPVDSPPPPLMKPETPPSSPDAKYETPRKSRFGNIYTSTPVLNKLSENSQGQYYAPVTALSYNSNNKSYQSLAQNQSSGYDTGSRNNVYSPVSSKTLDRAKSPYSSGSTPIPSSSVASRRQSRTDLIAPLRSPAPEDYTETIRVKSKAPQNYGDSETDYVQRFSKKTVPMKDGYTTETLESSENTTHSRSSYRESDGNRRHENNYSYVEVRPRESGGVIIQLRSGDGRRY